MGKSLGKKPIKISLAQNIKENVYKMHYRWYLTPEKLSEIYKQLDAKCWKCREEKGTLFHQWWTC